MPRPTVQDLPDRLRQLVLDALPGVRGQEDKTLVRLLRPRDGFFHQSADLQAQGRQVLTMGTVPWEMGTPAGALRVGPFEPVLLAARTPRRRFLKVAIGTAAAALAGVSLLGRERTVRADGLLDKFGRAASHAERAAILNNVYGSRTEEARILYVRILITPWPTQEARLVKDAMAGLEIGGDQYLYTLACYYVLYARHELDLKQESILRLAKLKDSLIRDNLELLKQHDYALYQECVKLLLR